MLSRLRAALAAAFVAASPWIAPGSAMAQAQFSYCQTPAGSLPYALNVLRLPQAWLKTCGTAYIAVLDNGIQTNHSSLAEGPGGNIRTHLSKDCTREANVVGQAQCVAPFPYAEAFAGFHPIHGFNPSYTPIVEEQITFGGRGHGTHVAGIVGATALAVTGSTFYGACRKCSVVLVRRDDDLALGLPPASQTRRAIPAAYASGAQVINLSAATTSFATDPLRIPILEALKREVIVVAASGNHERVMTPPGIEYPARLDGVLAVGAVKPAATSLGVDFWTPEPAAAPPGTANPTNLFGSNSGQQQFLTAPGRAVVSTFFHDSVWKEVQPPTDPAINCKSTTGPPAQAAFGNCSGTSMAAPYVSGIVGLVRSVQPTMRASLVKQTLRQTATNPDLPGQWSSTYGWGVPNAEAAVIAALGGPSIVNRTTPLFALQSAIESNHVFTVVPQVAMAALEGTLPPRPRDQDLTWPQVMARYQSVGQGIPGYASFTEAACPPEWPQGGSEGCTPTNWGAPMASASVMTTPRNPVPGGGPELLPLYRMSWRCGEQHFTSRTHALCTSGSQHVSHFYTSDINEVYAHISQGYRLDGIEGFVYPPSQAPIPPNAVKLCRKYNATRDDFILYAGSHAGVGACDAIPTSVLGPGPGTYVNYGGTDFIGFAYPVSAPAPLTISSPAASIAVYSGSNQIVPVNTALPQPVVAQVRDANNSPVSGITVTFTAPTSPGAGAVPSPQVVLSGANGLAQANLSANTTAGVYNVNATTVGVPTPASFVINNIPGPPHTVSVNSGSPQSKVVTESFLPLEAIVRDQWGNAMRRNTLVYWAAHPSPGGASATLAISESQTNNAGIASNWPTANAIAGSYTVSATVPNRPPVHFSLTNIAFAATTIELVDGSGQATNAGAAFSQPLRVRVRNQLGNPFAGATVNYSLPAQSQASAILSPPAPVTDANGIATTWATANANAGSYNAVATTAGVGGNVSFALQNIAVPTCTPGPVQYESSLPYPGAVGPDMAMLNTWTAAFSFTVGGGEHAIFAAAQHSNYPVYPLPGSVKLSISKCKGDFSVPAACQLQGNPRYINILAAANPAYWQACQIEPNATYYFNVQQLQCNSGWCGLRGNRY